jgi:hypothetical protein
MKKQRITFDAEISLVRKLKALVRQRRGEGGIPKPTMSSVLRDILRNALGA